MRPAGPEALVSMVKHSATPPWIGLAGPTASGKSSAALMLAQHWPLEIISVDSALVYRGMDIGTAKPSPQELKAVPHHLIDLIDPAESYSAARFVEDAKRMINEALSRGRWPLLVGGTMLYFKALMDGLATMPGADPLVREGLEQEAHERGWPALHAELMAVDPDTASRLKTTDAQRIQRALEVWRSTGVPLSQFHREGQAAQGWPPMLLLSLEPLNRAVLHERIAQRFDDMLARGFLDEVRALRRRGDLQPNLPSMRCVGYRQAWEAMDQGLEGEELLRVVRERGIAATRQLAKRQLTWLRSMSARRVIACDQDAASIEAGLLESLASLPALA